jgi:hypothetical protein
MPRFSPEINAGHILTAATIIVSVAVIYGTQSAQLEAHKEWLKRHDALLDKHSLNLSTLNAHTAGVEKVILNFQDQFKRLEESQKETSKDVKEILRHTSQK